MMEDNSSMRPAEIRRAILALTRQYWESTQAEGSTPGGTPKVNYAGRVFDDHELTNLVDSALDFWLTEGRYAEEFSGALAKVIGVSNVSLVNSGSSANLVALSALTSEKLRDRRLRPGDEVISVAAGFPSTVSPIIQNQCVPVFVDVDIPTYNIDIEMMARAVTPKTKCIFIAHTLGNPFRIDEVMQLAEQHRLWVVEDNCDALGSTYRSRPTGSFGHLSTISFYPAHHITTGEGGAVCTSDEMLSRIVQSVRDWGRDCYCAGGENNTCGRRFSQQWGSLPFGYDHKYVYTELGYNLKMTDMQAAIGAAQIRKLPTFCSRRRENFARHTIIFRRYEEFFVLPVASPHSDPAWFAFVLTVRPTAPFRRDDIVRHLSEHGIETRNLFAGNITRQPAFQTRAFRVADHLTNTDVVMNDSFFLGTYPGLGERAFDHIAEVVDAFMRRW